MKKIIRYAIILLSAILIVFFFFFLFSFLYYKLTSSDKEIENAENIKKLKVGMRVEEIKTIMGEPNGIEIIPGRYENEFDFQYIAPSGYSDNFHIFINRKDSIVLRISDGL